jgi:hypothetical protein
VTHHHEHAARGKPTGRLLERAATALGRQVQVGDDNRVKLTGRCRVRLDVTDDEVGAVGDAGCGGQPAGSVHGRG